MMIARLILHVMAKTHDEIVSRQNMFQERPSATLERVCETLLASPMKRKSYEPKGDIYKGTASASVIAQASMLAAPAFRVIDT